MRLEALNTAALSHACGSTRWVKAMEQRAPFASEAELFAAAEAEWNKLTSADWLEAFSHHPRIGQKTADPVASREQAGATSADPAVLAQLKQGNDAYEKKFGFVFLICATGKSAAEMLQVLQQRLARSREEEIVTAAAEQAKITKLRLEKWLQG